MEKLSEGVARSSNGMAWCFSEGEPKSKLALEIRNQISDEILTGGVGRGKRYKSYYRYVRWLKRRGWAL